MNQSNPAVGRGIAIHHVRTHYHDLGQGFPLLMVHGSGRDASGIGNGRTAMRPLGEDRRTRTADRLGLGCTEWLPGPRYDMDTWGKQVIGLLDALDLPGADIVGKTADGALALTPPGHDFDEVGRAQRTSSRRGGAFTTAGALSTRRARPARGSGTAGPVLTWRRGAARGAPTTSPTHGVINT